MATPASSNKHTNTPASSSRRATPPVSSSQADHEQASQTAPPVGVDASAEHAEQEEEEETLTDKRGTKRKLTSVVWDEFTRVKVKGVDKAKCSWCGKLLSGETRNGTKHLHAHLKICVYKKREGGKVQSSLRFGTNEQGHVAVENYVFDQEVARKALFCMIVLHEYPLSIVDHYGFRKFVSALQPLFKMITRNTIRKDIMTYYEREKSKGRFFIQKMNCRVAITTDLWTAQNQKRGYMAVTGHFIDDSWRLRSCILRLFSITCFVFAVVYA